MNEFLNQVRQELSRIWGGLTGTQRAIFLGVTIASILALIGLVIWAQTPDFQPLFTNLDDTDAGAIIQELQQDHVPYQLSPDGHRISVPGPKVAEMRLALAAKGLPNGQAQQGYSDLFDKNQQFGQTDAVQRLNMQRALQGELARTIRSMDGVENARVALALPPPDLFSDDQSSNPTATVMLQLKPGAQFGKEQAQTIVNLVAGSVPGLKPKNVMVADTMGRNYSQDLDLGDTSLALTDSQLDIKRSFERSLRQNIQDMLDQVLGPNGAVVQVQADFDFSQVETNQEIYQPVIQTPGGTQSGIIVSQHEMVEKYGNGASPVMGGVPGTAANIPTYQASGSSSTGNYSRTDVTRNYDINKEVKRIIAPPAQLKRLSVSVAVNGKIPASEQQSLQQMISAAAGIDPTRGDTLVVAAVPFNQQLEQQAATEMTNEEQQARMLSIAKVVGALVLGIVALVLLRRGLASREEELFEQLPMSMDRPGISISELGPVGEEDRKTHLQREISKVVKSQPEEVARLVKTWMIEDE